MKRLNSSQTKQRGFTLTEIAIVLGIVGLILGAIWVAAAAVYNNLRVSHANTQVLQIAQAVRALYATSNIIGGGGAANQTSALITAGAVPSDMVSGTTLVGAWGGSDVSIWSNAAGDGFTIVMTSVPQNACISLLTTVGGANADPGLYDASAAATAAAAGTDAIASNTKVTGVTPALAAAAALNRMGGCTNTSNKIKFGFSLRA